MALRQYQSPYATKRRRVSILPIAAVVLALVLSGGAGAFFGSGGDLGYLGDRLGVAALTGHDPTATVEVALADDADPRETPAGEQEPAVDGAPTATAPPDDDSVVDDPVTPTAEPTETPAQPAATSTPGPTATPDAGPPEDTAQAYLDAWNERDYEALYALASTETQGRIDRATFVERYEAIAAESGITQVEAHLDGGSNLDLTVPYRVTITMSTVGELEEKNTLLMVREETGWRVAWTPSLIFSDLSDGCIDFTLQTTRRGSILDRNGEPLAIDGEAGEIGVVPGELVDEETTIARLSELVDVPVADIQAAYADVDPAWFVPVKQYPSEVDPEIVSAIAEMPGVQVRSKTARIYPLAERAAHLTGYVTPITQEDRDADAEGALVGQEWVGRAGIEAGANDLLSGVPGGRLAIVDCETRAERSVLGERRAVEPKDVLLTIDKDFQIQVDKAVGDVKGSSVILDPRTGAVLAMVSHPSFDPNWFVSGFGARDRDYIADNDQRPLLNRAADAAYPTGSIFKVITMAAGMEELDLKGDSMVECPQEWSIPGTDQIYRDWTYEIGSPAQGQMTLHAALVNSCNTVFYQIGADVDTKDETALPDMTRGFGLGASTGIPYLFDVSGIVPDPEWKQENVGDFWARGDAVNMAIGQGYLEATPLQMAVAYAAIANGGSVLTPFVVEFTREGDSSLTRIGKRAVDHKLPVSKANIKEIQSALRDQTSNSWGAGSVTVFGDFAWPIAGKTGTAQNQMTASQKPHSWFAAFGPYGDTATITSIVMVESVGEGVSFAAPTTRKIYEAYLKTDLADADR